MQQRLLWIAFNQFMEFNDENTFVASILDDFISKITTATVLNSISGRKEIWNNQQVTK